MDERLLEILEDINPEVDFETCTTLIDDHLLDSLSIISLVAEIEEEFDITIPTVEIIPENFNSAENFWKKISTMIGQAVENDYKTFGGRLRCSQSQHIFPLKRFYCFL